MGADGKPLALIKKSSRLTKKEIKEREEHEQKYEGIGTDKLKPPSYLCKIGKKKFKEIIQEYEGTGILNNLDLDALTIYVQAYAQYVKRVKIQNDDKAQRTIEEENKLQILIDKSEKTMKDLGSKLGLTVSDRAKVGAIKSSMQEQEKDPLNQALKEAGL